MNTLTLPTGRVIRLDQVEFFTASQLFFYGSFDVTPYLSGEQKRSFAGYDVAHANTDASNAARDKSGQTHYADGKDMSYWDIAKDTASGIGNDVSSAAQSLRDFAGIGPENAGKRSPLFWTALAVGLGFLLYQIGAFAWLKKKITA